MSLRLVFSIRAEAQLDALFDYLATQASPQTAERFVSAILDRLQRLLDTPLQGTKRDDVLPGLRTLGLHRRVTIAFCVGSEEIVVLGVFYGGQDFEARLGER